MTVTTTTPTMGGMATVEGETAAVILLAILEARMGLMGREMGSRVGGQERISPPSSLTILSSPRVLEDISSTVEGVEGSCSMVRGRQWRKVRVRAMEAGGRDTGLVRDCRGLSSWK